MTERDTRLEEIALQPKVVEVDGQRMENHSLKDQIELDRIWLRRKRPKVERGAFV